MIYGRESDPRNFLKNFHIYSFTTLVPEKCFQKVNMFSLSILHHVLRISSSSCDYLLCSSDPEQRSLLVAIRSSPVAPFIFYSKRNTFSQFCPKVTRRRCKKIWNINKMFASTHNAYIACFFASNRSHVFRMALPFSNLRSSFRFLVFPSSISKNVSSGIRILKLTFIWIQNVIMEI